MPRQFMRENNRLKAPLKPIRTSFMIQMRQGSYTALVKHCPLDSSFQPGRRREARQYEVTRCQELLVFLSSEKKDNSGGINVQNSSVGLSGQYIEGILLKEISKYSLLSMPPSLFLISFCAPTIPVLICL